MLADAIRAEGYRLSKNRTVVFWSVMFVPLAWLALGLINIVWTRINQPKATEVGLPEAAGSPLDLAGTMLEAVGIVANPFVMLFVMIAAAILYSGDYRWETWRLVTPRNERLNLLLAKVIAVAGAALATMLLFLLATFIGSVVQALVFDRPLTFAGDLGDVGQFFMLFGLGLVRVMQFTMLALVVAVMSRSLLAALFLPLVVGAAQLALPLVLLPRGIMPHSWAGQLLQPGEAVKALELLIAGAPIPPPVGDGLALKAWASIALWSLVPLGGAIAWFKRQDLSKE